MSEKRIYAEFYGSHYPDYGTAEIDVLIDCDGTELDIRLELDTDSLEIRMQCGDNVVYKITNLNRTAALSIEK